MGEVRAISRELQAVGKDKDVRQGKSLQRIRSMVNNGQVVAVFVPLLRDLLSSPDVAAEARETILYILADVMEKQVQREQLWTFDELWMQLWSEFISSPEAVGKTLSSSLSSVALEDMVRLTETLEPEVIIKKCVEHRLPSIRAVSLLNFGTALVKAWPCAAADQSEKLHNAYIDAYLAIAQLLDDAGGHAIGVQKAAAGVIDAMLAAYLAMEPRSFFPVALLRPHWSFVSVYAVPIIEMARLLESLLPKLSLQPHDPTHVLVTQSCPWLPEGELNEKNVRPAPRTNEEWPVLAAEAAAARAALLWILVSVGGMARRRREEEIDAKGMQQASERCGSLIYDLIREEAGSLAGTTSKPKAPRELMTIPAPDAILAALVYATQASNSTWRLHFAQCRAWLMYGIVSLASNSRDAHEHLLLATEHILHGADVLAHRDTPLPRFCTESVCSIIALWPLGHLDTTSQQDMQRFLASACKVIAMGASILPRTATPSPSRAFVCLRSASEALVQVLMWMEAGHSGGPQDVRTHLTRGGQLGPVVAAMLCSSACSRAAAEANHQPWQACSQRILDAAAYMLQPTSSVSDREAFAAQSCAAGWYMAYLLSLLYKVNPAYGDSAAVGILEVLSNHMALHAFPLAMIAAVCEDAGRLAIWDEADRTALASALHAESSKVDATAAPYMSSLIRALQQPSNTARSGAHRLATPLCAAEVGGKPELATQPLLWLHSFGHMHGFDHGGPLDEAAVKVMSGPPVMIGLRVQVMRREVGIAHVTLRFDIFNVTPARLQNLKVSIALAAKDPDELKRENILDAWSFTRGQRRPVTFHAAEMQSKSSLVMWRDVLIRAMRPISVVCSLEYDNVQVVASGPADGTPSGADGGDVDVWSDDEDAEAFSFSTSPCLLPLSVYFHPFHGFDNPPGDVFPPPAVNILCAHSVTVQLSQGLSEWHPAGFQKVIAFSHDAAGAAGVRACFAGVAMDKASVACLLVREERPNTSSVEVRSSSAKVMQELAATLTFWLTE